MIQTTIEEDIEVAVIIITKVEEEDPRDVLYVIRLIDHLCFECPIKDQNDLKFCSKCGVGEHSLEDFPIILEKKMNKKNVNHLLRVHKNDAVNSRNI